jgi:hypothetical protein
MSEEPGGNYRAVLLSSESRKLKGAMSLLGDAVVANSGRIGQSDTSELETERDPISQNYKLKVI